VAFWAVLLNAVPVSRAQLDPPPPKEKKICREEDLEKVSVSVAGGRGAFV